MIREYVAHTNESLRAAVKEYFEDKAACERRHGKIGTWNVKFVTDMSLLFHENTKTSGGRSFNEDLGAWDTWRRVEDKSLTRLCRASRRASSR